MACDPPDRPRSARFPCGSGVGTRTLPRILLTRIRHPPRRATLRLRGGEQVCNTNLGFLEKIGNFAPLATGHPPRRSESSRLLERRRENHLTETSFWDLLCKQVVPAWLAGRTTRDFFAYQRSSPNSRTRTADIRIVGRHKWTINLNRKKLRDQVIRVGAIVFLNTLGRNFGYSSCARNEIRDYQTFAPSPWANHSPAASMAVISETSSRTLSRRPCSR